MKKHNSEEEAKALIEMGATMVDTEKTVKGLLKQIDTLRKTARKALRCLEDKEVANIYTIASIHGVRLSQAYITKAQPIFKKLKTLSKYK